MERDSYEDNAHLLGWITGAVVAALVLLFVFGRVSDAAPVTAAVTTDGGTVLRAQLPADKFQVVLKNEANGSTHPWARHSYADRYSCERAIKGVNAALRAIADPDPAHEVVQPTDADHELVKDVTTVLAMIMQNTGKAPDLSISCEVSGSQGA